MRLPQSLPWREDQRRNRPGSQGRTISEEGVAAAARHQEHDPHDTARKNTEQERLPNRRKASHEPDHSRQFGVSSTHRSPADDLENEEDGKR